MLSALPLGESIEYSPTLKKLGVSVGIYALDEFIFSIMTKGISAIELGYARQHTDEDDSVTATSDLASSVF